MLNTYLKKIGVILIIVVIAVFALRTVWYTIAIGFKVAVVVLIVAAAYYVYTRIKR